MSSCLIGDVRHAAYLHHKVGHDRRRHLRIRCQFTVCSGVGLQRARHQLRAVGVDHAAGWGGCRCRGLVNFPVQLHGLAGPVASDLLALCIQTHQPAGLQRAHAGIGGGDEVAIGQAQADVACGGVHISPHKQAAAHVGAFVAGVALVHEGGVRGHACNCAKALVKKSVLASPLPLRTPAAPKQPPAAGPAARRRAASSATSASSARRTSTICITAPHYAARGTSNCNGLMPGASTYTPLPCRKSTSLLIRHEST